ncbi:MAG: GC-type dockerin domain-anchored protein [Phycisphaerales bacterium]|nr:GC-type dockerin domain-anchored protein [Phycisphaerales bacterium]
MHTATRPFRTLVAALTACAGTAALADISNGGFESLPAVTGWTTSGTVALSTGAPAAPTQGAYAALLTAGNTAAATLAALLGCTTAQLMAEAGTTTAVRDGAAILQTFTVNSGDTISFDFAFNNAETTNNLLWPDTAFVVVNGVPQKLAGSATTPQGWTPVQQVSKSNLTGGTITLAFAVCNFADFAVDSQLMIDNVRIITGSNCGPADLGGQGGVAAPDVHLNNNDFIVFIDYFFQNDARADLGSQGGVAGADGLHDNNDFVAFIDAFFTRLAAGGCD